MLMSSTQRAFFLGFGFLMVLVLVGCSRGTGGAGASAKLGQENASNTHSGGMTSLVNQESTIHFTLSGGNNGRYTVHASLPTSKLRHGHREFTVDVEQSGMSVFLVFYGYEGPATYTLAQIINGGDVHIALGKNTSSWDLSLQAKAHCTMTVQSIMLIQSTGLGRMKGTFSCPLLFSSTPNHPAKPVTVSNGTFDVAIIIES